MQPDYAEAHYNLGARPCRLGPAQRRDPHFGRPLRSQARFSGSPHEPRSLQLPRANNGSAVRLKRATPGRSHHAGQHIEIERLGEPRLPSFDGDRAHDGVVGAKRHRRDVQSICRRSDSSASRSRSRALAATPPPTHSVRTLCLLKRRPLPCPPDNRPRPLESWRPRSAMDEGDPICISPNSWPPFEPPARAGEEISLHVLRGLLGSLGRTA